MRKSFIISLLFILIISSVNVFSVDENCDSYFIEEGGSITISEFSEEYEIYSDVITDSYALIKVIDESAKIDVDDDYEYDSGFFVTVKDTITDPDYADVVEVCIATPHYPDCMILDELQVIENYIFKDYKLDIEAVDVSGVDATISLDGTSRTDGTCVPFYYGGNLCKQNQEIISVYGDTVDTVEFCLYTGNSQADCNDYAPECLNPTSCYDSEDGIDQFHKGTVSTGAFDNTDYCKSVYQLLEYYCDSNIRNELTLNCEHGCEDGACLEESKNSCSDSDDENYFNKGFVEGINLYGDYEYWDHCSGDRLYEYTCTADSTSFSISKECDYGCHDGACILESEACVDSDDLDMNLKGATTLFDGTLNEDYCKDDNSIVEYYCADGSSVYVSEYCADGCKDGACVTGLSCIDTDGGKEYYEFGKVTEGDVSQADYCMDEKRLGEYHCFGPEGYDRETYVCEFGCEDGVCITKDDWFCQDTDGGNNVFNVGKVTTNFESFQDYCSSDVRQVEYYCVGNEYREVSIDCEFGCRYGSCLSVESTSEIIEELKAVANEVASNLPDINLDVDVTLPDVNVNLGNGLENAAETITDAIPEIGEGEEKTWCEQGCILNDKCVYYGIRKSGTFCDLNGEFQNQFSRGITCDNDYECLSNVCAGEKCISSNMIQRLIAWLASLFN